MLDVDFVSQAQQLADAGYEATFLSVLPEDQAAMFARIQDQVAGTSLPGYESEPEEALRQLVQVGVTSCVTTGSGSLQNSRKQHCSMCFMGLKTSENLLQAVSTYMQHCTGLPGRTNARLYA